MNSRFLKHLATAAFVFAAPLALADNPGLDQEIRQQGRDALAAMQADVLNQVDGRGSALALLSGVLEAAPAGPAPVTTARSEPCAPGQASSLLVDILPALPALPTVRAPLLLGVH